MTNYSQNGYTAPIVPVSRQVPGGVLPLRPGPAGDLLAWVARQFHALVEPLNWPGCWGYAYRDIRGSTGLSNHASGTAVDLNAPKHPLSVRNTFTAAQVSAIRGILAKTGGCVRWGGDYVGRVDEMHFEIVANETRCAAALIALAKPATPAETENTEVEIVQSITVTPPNAGENRIRVNLSGSQGAAVIVRPRIGLDGFAKPMWVGHIFAWGSDKAGIGHDPKGTVPDQLTTHRRYELPGALWADLYYSAAEPFDVDVVG